jgi:hypothetical protein
MGAELATWRDAVSVMAWAWRSIAINTMERAMERRAQAMTNKGQGHDE